MDTTVVFLLIPGLNSSKAWWEYKYDEKSKKISKVSFLKKLKQLGHVFTITFPWFNTDYYYKNPNKLDAFRWKRYYKKYKPHSANIQFTISDLNYDNICRWLHTDLRKLYPTQKIIPIGHSYGGPIAYIFTKLYAKECLFCCSIDGAVLGKSLQKFHLAHAKKNSALVAKYFPNDESLHKILEQIRIKQNPNFEIDLVNKLIEYHSIMWKSRYLPKKIKLYCPTIFFRSYYTNPKPDSHEVMWNTWSIEERNKPIWTICVLFRCASFYLA